MKYTTAILALTASFALGNNIIENKSKCPAFLKEVKGLTGSMNNGRGRRAIQGKRKKVRGEKSPFIQTPEPGSGDDVTTAEVTTMEGTTVEVTTMEATTVEITTEKVTEVVGSGDEVTIVSTEPTTTVAESTTADPVSETTTESVTNKITTTITEPVPEEDNLATIIILDETGSMQWLGGKARKGRQIVIKKFNTFMTNLQKQVRSGEVPDSTFTLVTFNRKARWLQYDSILEMPQLEEKHYNPGYGTNLYDTIGCVMAKFNEENDGASNVRMFVISDGAHRLGPKEQKMSVGYEIEEIEKAITGLREHGWDFAIYGAVNENEKKRLKKQALNMGFRQSERKMFDFSKNSMGSLLKSLLSNMGSKTEADLPDCKTWKGKKCEKGKAGKLCRKGRKSLEARGECKFYKKDE